MTRPPPPLPPEPSWAPPPQGQPPGRWWDVPADAERRAAVRSARQAGGVAFATVMVAGLAQSVSQWAPVATFLVGIAGTVVLARRARGQGLPLGDVISTVLITFALGFGVLIALTVVVAILAFGACFVMLGNSSSRGFH